MNLRSTLLMMLALPGCFLLEVDDSPKDTREGFHDITVNWRLMNLDGTVMSACPPGFSTLVTHLYQAGYTEPPDALIKTPCTPEGTLTQPTATAGRLPVPDDIAGAAFPYDPQKDVWMDLTEETQLSIKASSYLYYIEKLDGDVSIDFDIYPEGGVGVAAWELHSSFTSAPIPSCESAGVDEIEAAVRRYDAEEGAPFVAVGSWPCEAVDPYFYYDPTGSGLTLDSSFGPYRLGSGHTEVLLPGDYAAELRAKRSGAVVGTGIGYFTAVDGNGARLINSDPIVITDR